MTGESEQNVEVQRTEHKFILNRREAGLLIRRLDNIMPRDANSTGPDGYEIRSLYFDTLSDRSCVEKLDGLEVHEKVRARIYGTDDSVIKLECTRKVGQNQTKRSLLISRPLVEELSRGQYGGLLELEDPMALQFFRKLSGGMLPKNIIQYQRLSFCLDTNNTRITFDSDIRSTESCMDLFQEPLLANPILPAELVVLEVKFNNFLLEYMEKALRSIHASPTSYSKYMNGRRFYRSMI